MAKRIQASEAPAVDVPAAVSAAAPEEIKADALAVPKNRYLVEFNPPTPIGPRAARMEVEADSATEALAFWRRETGFTGALAVAPVVTEILPGSDATSEG